MGRKKKLADCQSRMDKFHLETVCDAIRRSNSVIMRAAALLNCDWNTVVSYMARYPECQAAYDESERHVTDIARGSVVQGIIKGAKSGDTADAKWWLSKKAKNQGFGDVVRNEITGADGGPVQIEGFTRKELAEIAKMALEVEVDSDGTSDS